MLSDVTAEMISLVPGLTVSLAGGRGGPGYIYAREEQQIGTVRSLNQKTWRIDGDAPGYPFSSEREATLELFRRVSTTAASVAPKE